MLKTREPGVKTVLVKNPNWWGPDEGNVTMIGVSLNGIRKYVTVLATLGSQTSEDLRGRYQRLWTEGVVLAPQVPSSDATMTDHVIVEQTTEKE